MDLGQELVVPEPWEAPQPAYLASCGRVFRGDDGCPVCGSEALSLHPYYYSQGLYVVKTNKIKHLKFEILGSGKNFVHF